MNALFNLEPKDYEFLCLLNSSIKINEHNHPIIFVNTPERSFHGKDWTCNKCNINFSFNYPSFYCTFCDFDLCQNCLGKHKLNEIELYEYNINNNNLQPEGLNNNFQWRKKYPGHIHLLTLIKKRNKNYSWKCNNCAQIFQNTDTSYYCSLCDFYLCQNCFNSNRMEPNISLNNVQQSHNNNFQLKSFAILNKEYQNKNLLYCPLFLQLLFITLSNGINEEEALNEIQKVFNLQNINIENNYCLDTYNNLYDYKNINIANLIYSKYDTNIQIFFSNFVTNISNDIYKLNDFISQKTNGKINNYYNILDFADVKAILTNILYFNEEWKKEFKLINGNILFSKSNGQIQDVQFMINEDMYKYYKDNSIEVIELKYKMDNLTALIILPDISFPVDNLISELTQAKYDLLYSKLTNKKIKIIIPKFKFVNQDVRINLNEMLKKMGLTKIYSGLTLYSNDFQIDKVLQTNLLDVNEKGAEICSNILSNNYSDLDLSNAMIVNRPFLFIVRNDKFNPGRDIILISKIEEI